MLVICKKPCCYNINGYCDKQFLIIDARGICAYAANEQRFGTESQEPRDSVFRSQYTEQEPAHLTETQKIEEKTEVDSEDVNDGQDEKN